MRSGPYSSSLFLFLAIPEIRTNSSSKKEKRRVERRIKESGIVPSSDLCFCDAAKLCLLREKWGGRKKKKEGEKEAGFGGLRNQPWGPLSLSL